MPTDQVVVFITDDVLEQFKTMLPMPLLAIALQSLRENRPFEPDGRVRTFNWPPEPTTAHMNAHRVHYFDLRFPVPTAKGTESVLADLGWNTSPVFGAADVRVLANVEVFADMTRTDKKLRDAGSGWWAYLAGRFTSGIIQH